MFQTLKYIPAKILFIEGEVVGVLAFMVGGLIWTIIPFIDRGKSPQMRFIFNVFGVVVVLFIVVMTIIGFVT